MSEVAVTGRYPLPTSGNAASHAAAAAGYEHVGWRCEHYDMTRLLDVAPSSHLINARCGCTMVPVYAKPVASDEAKIRDAMAEAQDHPGRIVTR